MSGFCGLTAHSIRSKLFIHGSGQHAQLAHKLYLSVVSRSTHGLKAVGRIEKHYFSKIYQLVIWSAWFPVSDVCSAYHNFFQVYIRFV